MRLKTFFIIELFFLINICSSQDVVVYNATGRTIFFNESLYWNYAIQIYQDVYYYPYQNKLLKKNIIKTDKQIIKKILKGLDQSKYFKKVNMLYIEVRNKLGKLNQQPLLRIPLVFTKIKIFKANGKFNYTDEITNDEILNYEITNDCCIIL